MEDLTRDLEEKGRCLSTLQTMTICDYGRSASVNLS